MSKAGKIQTKLRFPHEFVKVFVKTFMESAAHFVKRGSRIQT